MLGFGRFRVIAAGVCLAVVGCTTSSIGLDLSLRGVLTLVLTRESGSSSVRADAFVKDNGSVAANVELASNQILSVNGTNLTPGFVNVLGHVGGQLQAVDAPSEYAINFDNAGDIQSMSAAPPENFSATSPPDGGSVSTSGFAVTWTPSGAADTKVDIEIRGLGPDGPDADSDPDVLFKTFTDLDDDGSTTISDTDLAGFNKGVLNLEIHRFHEVDQTIGFASGHVRLVNVKKLALNLE